jgi:hypothetical protein
MDSILQTVHTRALRRAAELLGGNDALRLYLGVTPVILGIWMQGRIAPPSDVFLQVVDLLFERDETIPRDAKIDRGD